ncbi:MAG: hypothetical protein OXU20_11035 [Myxococcales bacterium]|nr:hypothetical protein [Myxococcales bacterium]MDD9969053.1 hypothetical protein [Myxococcales bacterium]
MNDLASRKQTEFLERTEEIVRWVKCNLGYRGSKQTGDFQGLVMERLYRRDTYRAAFEEDPTRLRPMIRRVTRNVIIDEIRARRAQKRVPAHLQEPIEGEHEPVDVSAKVPERVAEWNQRENLLREELARIASNESGSLRQPEKMVYAFEQAFFHGESRRAIACQLNEPKSTVDHWIHVLVLQLARRMAEREG